MRGTKRMEDMLTSNAYPRSTLQRTHQNQKTPSPEELPRMSAHTSIHFRGYVLRIVSERL